MVSLAETHREGIHYTVGHVALELRRTAWLLRGFAPLVSATRGRFARIAT